jgi:hypothetical protein
MPPRDFIFSCDARPHPSPLPRGEGERIAARDNRVHSCFSNRRFVASHEAENNLSAFISSGRSRAFLPLLGERAGVRADTLSN